MNKKEYANNLHNKKYNCAQAVACAFAEEAGIDPKTLFQACEGFGLGMGCMDGTCGAISGAVMLAGFVSSDGETDNPGTKASTYKISQQMVDKFYQKNGATRCRDLKGIDTGKVMRSCPGCIEDAVEIIEEVLGL